jgi:hypothetical protein
MPEKSNGAPMPRKRKPPSSDEPPGRRQYNAAFSPSMADKIDATAATLGVEPVALIRMIVHKHIADYVAEANAIREADRKSESE